MCVHVCMYVCMYLHNVWSPLVEASLSKVHPGRPFIQCPICFNGIDKVNFNRPNPNRALHFLHQHAGEKGETGGEVVEIVVIFYWDTAYRSRGPGECFYYKILTIFLTCPFN